MGLLGRVRKAFSRTGRDISAARQAELRGDLAKAAALFGRAGENGEVARIMLMRGEAEPDPKTRLQHYVQAASIAPIDNPLQKIARMRRAQVMTLLIKGGAVSASSRADLLQAAKDLEELGEPGEAAEAYKLAGDHESEARALASAGKIEELETLLDSEQAEARERRKQRTRHEEIDLASATGRRREALSLAETAVDDPGGAKIRGDALRAKRLLGPTIRVEIAGKKSTFVIGEAIIIGRSEGEIQISSHAVSRRHLQIARRGEVVVVSELGSRNGTTLRGIAIGGEIPVGDGVEVLLGNEVPVRVTPSTDFAGAISIEAGGSKYVATLGAARLGIGDWELVVGAENWIELVFASPAAYLGGVVLTSPTALLQRDEIASERGASPVVKFF